jgi:hypothetical protein
MSILYQVIVDQSPTSVPFVGKRAMTKETCGNMWKTYTFLGLLFIIANIAMRLTVLEIFSICIFLKCTEE